MPPDCIFVYGTLRRGSNSKFARLLAADAQFLGEARMPGRVRRIGKYRAAVPSNHHGEWIDGEVFRIFNPDWILPVLDKYEGPDYQRGIVPVRLKSGKQIEAWVYLLTTRASSPPADSAVYRRL